MWLAPGSYTGQNETSIPCPACHISQLIRSVYSAFIASFVRMPIEDAQYRRLNNVSPLSGDLCLLHDPGAPLSDDHVLTSATTKRTPLACFLPGYRIPNQAHMTAVHVRTPGFGTRS
jgi:hypothetical protein